MQKQFFHMRLRLAFALVLLGHMVAAAAFWPSAAQAADRGRLEAFLQVTGFDVALDSIALAAEDAPAMLGIRAEEFGLQWTTAAEEVFDRKLMQGMALDILAKTLSDELLTHAAEFYASPLGLRLVEVENASHMNDDKEAKAEAGAALVEEMRQTDPERLAMFERMNASIDSDGMGVRAVQEIQFRFLMAASQAGVIKQRFDADGLRAMLKGNEDEMRKSMSEGALRSAARTYADFTTEEVRTYTEALETEQMQQVYQLMNAIQWEVMANRFEALAVKMAGMSRGEEL